MNAYYRDITGEVGARTEGGDVCPHVKEVIDAAVITISLEGVGGRIVMNDPRCRLSKKACPTRGNTTRMVWVRTVEIPSPVELSERKAWITSTRWASTCPRESR